MSSSKLSNNVPPIQDGSCPICLMELDKSNQSLTDKVVALCIKKHEFHAICIDTWARVHRNCPLCRNLITVLSNGMSMPGPAYQEPGPVVPGGGNPFVQRVRAIQNLGADENNYHRHTAAFIGHRIRIARRRASLSQSPQQDGMQRINELNMGRRVMPSPASSGPSPAPRGMPLLDLPPLLELNNQFMDGDENREGILNHMNLDDANEMDVQENTSGNYRGIFERQDFSNK